MAQQNNNQSEIDVGQLSFERAIEELESIVRRLEDGKVPLEESVAIYERGEALKRRCEENHARCIGQSDRHRAA
jgi:exodeoxyribonuclease VII small subunit